ncbi:LysR family transcriptional regulator [Altererythrobacter sp.]|uniref:LysR family transcriptional regulator n=1 Tax=Altererythrobacter sp. TaxID=1872480 RepID=UPI003D0B4A80
MDLLAAYRAFVAVADHGGFTAGARICGQSQSTVSRQVADLEQYLGARLLRRTTRRVALTSDGEQLLEKARGLIAMLGEAERSVGRRALDVAGHLRIAAPAALGHVLLAPLLCSFLSRHPGMEGEMLTLRSREAAYVVNVAADLAIEIGPLQARLGERRKLGDVPMVLCGSPLLIRDLGAPKTVEDIARLPAVVSVPPGMEPHVWRLERGAEHREVDPSPRLRCDNLEALRAAVLESVGIALVPLWLIHHDLASGRLWRLLPQWHGGLQPLFAGPPGKGRPGPHARAFLDYLSSSLAREGIFA